MKSMTGYGHSSYRSENYILELEIKSYNNRFLDINFNLSPLVSSFENYIKNEIEKVAKRGHIELSIKLKIISSPARVYLDEGLLDAYLAAFDEAGEKLKLSEITVSDLLAVDGLFTADKNFDQSLYKEGVETALSAALESFSLSKEREGKGTEEDLRRLGESFSLSRDEIEKNASALENHLKTLLITKFNELKETREDDPRFLAEVAALLVKYSINEELSRLKVHLKEYFRLLSENAPVGKQLDFLCQEMNRECNTIASKSQMVEINLLVVKMKDDLENIREQIRNIE